MGKDKINFRQSMKHAHGAASMEDAVGITKLCTLNNKYGDIEEARNLRVTGLMKWSFDDFIVQEVWPNNAFMNQENNNNNNKEEEEEKGKNDNKEFLLSIISEGITDCKIAEIIKRKCEPCKISLYFVTPIDFCSSQERFVLVRCPISSNIKRNFQSSQTINIMEGIIIIGKAINISWKYNKLSPIPINFLPNLRYSIILRGIKGSLADILPRLEGLQTNGFINYSHLARHGVSLNNAFESGRKLIHRDYVEFIQHYIKSLTERSPLLLKEIPSLLEIISNSNSTKKDWISIKNSIEYSLKNDKPLIYKPQTGLYYPHHNLLYDFIERASDLFPKRHDSAQVIRESIPRLILQEKLRSVADVHFNSLASLRWEMYGNKVVVGDLVIPEEEKNNNNSIIDIFEAPADHINGEMTSMHHLEWLSLTGEEHLKSLLKKIHIVKTKEEAKNFNIHQVVLPVLGNAAEHLIFPNNRIKEASERLSYELQIDGLSQMKAAPPATYRRLVTRPINLSYCIFDKERGWCWESSNNNNNNNPIRPQLYEDQEGIIRQPSPLFISTNKNMIARRGIRGIEQRANFIKPARRSGMTCVIQLTLPRGSAITSALREVFQFATLDLGGIFRLLR